MPLLYNITKAHGFFAGKYIVFEFQIVDRAGVAQDISGWALGWEMFEEGAKAGSDPLIAKATGAGIQTTNGPGGICQVTVAVADTTALQGKRYWHELFRTDTGFEGLITYGTVELQASLSRV